MNKKIRILLYIISALVFLFWIVKDTETGIMIWASFAALSGLLCSYWHKKAIFFLY
jgi:hypothetical protein